MPNVSKGSLYRRRETRNWFLKFYVDGHLERESTGTSDRAEAERILRRRIEDARNGLHEGARERVTFAEMKDELFRNYDFKRNRTDPRPRVKRLEEHFGGLRGEEIDSERIKRYSR